MSVNDELQAHLIAILEHARDALKLLDEGATLTPSITLPAGSTACTHPNKQRSMGGYWFCPDCNTEGRDG